MKHARQNVVTRLAEPGAGQMNPVAVYIRRSDEKQENTPHVQLNWASQKAMSMDLAVQVDKGVLDRLIQMGGGREGNLFLDTDISGTVGSRPGMNALLAAAKNREFTQLFVRHLDRTLRPNQTFKGMALIAELHAAGVTIVTENQTWPPPARGDKMDIGAELSAYLQFRGAGDEVLKIAERVIPVMTKLAAEGHWTGGPPPYGFKRVLVDAQDNVIRDLLPGERVKTAGQHVQIRPGDMGKIEVWMEIMDLRVRLNWGYCRIARQLNDRQVPSPLAAKPKCSGLWHGSTVKRLLQNTAIIAQTSYGKTSEGKLLRVTGNGTPPRGVADHERIDDRGYRRVVNPPNVVVSGQIGYEPLIAPATFDQVQAGIEERGRSSRGIPRASDPGKYPLSGIVFDATPGCGASMCGRTQQYSKYICSRYANGLGKCAHRTVDAESLVVVVLDALTSKVSNVPEGRLRARLAELCKQQMGSRPPAASRANQLAAELRKLEQQQATADQNIALAQDDEEQAAIRKVRSDLASRRKFLETERQSIGTSGKAGSSAENVNAALRLLKDLTSLAKVPAARAELRPLLERLGVRVHLRFQSVPYGAKTREVIKSAVITVGGIEPDEHDFQHTPGMSPAPSPADPGQAAGPKKTKGTSRKSDPATTNNLCTIQQGRDARDTGGRGGRS